MHRNLSIYLDLVRFLAALMVFVVHANYERFTGGLPLLWHFKDLGNDAVMVFFVLSGFVIAYVAAHKERTIEEYAASRFARLYSVVVPALILTMLLDGERPAGAFVTPLDLAQPTVSKHLKVLHEAGLVRVRPDGNRRLFSLEPQSLAELDAWLAPFRRRWADRLDLLEQHLDEHPDRKG